MRNRRARNSHEVAIFVSQCSCSFRCGLKRPLSSCTFNAPEVPEKKLIISLPDDFKVSLIAYCHFVEYQANSAFKIIIFFQYDACPAQEVVQDACVAEPCIKRQEPCNKEEQSDLTKPHSQKDAPRKILVAKRGNHATFVYIRITNNCMKKSQIMPYANFKTFCHLFSLRTTKEKVFL